MTARFRHRNLPTLLLQARETVMDYFRPNLRKHGLTDQKWRVLRALDERGDMEVGQLAKICSIVGPSLSGVLDRLERDDMIRRTRVSTDHRRVIIELTPGSRRLVARLAGHVEAQYARIESQLGSRDLEALYALLDRVNALPGPGADSASSTSSASAADTPQSSSSGHSACASSARRKRAS